MNSARGGAVSKKLCKLATTSPYAGNSTEAKPARASGNQRRGAPTTETEQGCCQKKVN
jgi:hypothetical protein